MIKWTTRIITLSLLILTHQVFNPFGLLAGTEEKEEPKKEEIEDPDKKSWEYSDEGRRDPFAFFEKVKEKKKKNAPIVVPTPEEDMAKQINTLIASAEHSLTGDDPQPKHALECVGKIQQKLKEALRRKILTDLNIEIVKERCQQLSTAAHRLVARQDIEKEFHDLNLTVDGIIWREKSQRAVINAKHILKSGQKVPLQIDDNKTFVDAIHQDHVIIRYRGFKFRVDMNG